MLTKIIMPSGGQTTNESLIVKWHKKKGDSVKKGDVLFEIETDKAVMEIESYAEGILLGTKFAEGEYASTGQVVAYIGNEGDKLPDVFTGTAPKADNGTSVKEDAESFLTGTAGSATKGDTGSDKIASSASYENEDDEYQPIITRRQMSPTSIGGGHRFDFQPESISSASLKRRRSKEIFLQPKNFLLNRSVVKKNISLKSDAVTHFTELNKAETGLDASAASKYGASEILASPAARYLAKQEKIEIGKVGKKLPGQIIKRADVESYIREKACVSVTGNIGKYTGTTAKSTNNAAACTNEFYYIETSSIRRTIARRMSESVSTAPTFNVNVEVDMTRVIGLRQEFNEYLKSAGVKVSFNDIIMKCVSKAISKYPLINSNYGEERIKIYNDVNFGLAVGLEKGLVVPVVREVNNKSLAEIAGENADNIEKAKVGKLKEAQMSGGTITLSNLGMFGVECFTAIINQPESCILAVGGIIEKPVVLNGAVVPRPMMNITATFDHRVIDGAVGAEFLKEVKTLLEKPQLLLV